MDQYTLKISPLKQEGMVLLVVLWISLLTAIPTVYLLSSSIINTKLTTGLWVQAQQFEAAEAGLLEGERKLTQLVLNSGRYNKINTVLPTSTYGNYRITLNVTRLPQAFCIMPSRLKGYYYQLTATAQIIDSHSTKTPLSLQSIIALPGTEPCNQSLTKRQAGRSAWCQLASY